MTGPIDVDTPVVTADDGTNLTQPVDDNGAFNDAVNAGLNGSPEVVAANANAAAMQGFVKDIQDLLKENPAKEIRQIYEQKLADSEQGDEGGGAGSAT